MDELPRGCALFLTVGPSLIIGGKRPGQITPPNRTGGAAALDRRVRLNPAKYPCTILNREVLSPSLRAHIGDFGSVAATKCATSNEDGPF
jgi:hypothetical protein